MDENRMNLIGSGYSRLKSLPVFFEGCHKSNLSLLFILLKHTLLNAELECLSILKAFQQKTLAFFPVDLFIC